MRNSYIDTQSELSFLETPPQKLKEENGVESVVDRSEQVLTTLEAIIESEELPNYVYSELGEEITKRILKGTGSIQVCVHDRGLVLLPETKSVLFPIRSIPYTEMWIRSPWHTASANFDNTFLTLNVSPDNNNLETMERGGIDPEDLDGMIIDRPLKDSKVKPDSILGPDTSTVQDKKAYSRVYSLVAAGFKRGLLGDTAVEDLPDVSKLSPKEVIFYYQRMYKGPATGTDYTGIQIIEEGSKRSAISAEDEYVLTESKFSSEIINPSENIFKGLIPENISLANQYVRPIISEINNAIKGINNKFHRKLYTELDGNDLVGTLLYKKSENRYNNRAELENNLAPMVLSPDVCIFRGFRPVFEEDTLVILKTSNGWKSKFFQYHNGDESLAERIDNWVETI